MQIVTHTQSAEAVSARVRISMRIDLEVLNSVDLIITTSITQSGDERVSVSVFLVRVNSQYQGAVFDIPSENQRIRLRQTVKEKETV